MLTMKLCADMDHVKKLCEFQGLPFDGNIRAFCCEERGEETGYCLFSTENGQAEILAVSCGKDDFFGRWPYPRGVERLFRTGRGRVCFVSLR